MVEVAGKPVLERIADHMNKHGIWRIVVNLHAFPEVVMKAFGQRFIYIYEPIPMGEFATLQLVKGLFPMEPIYCMNGDTTTDFWPKEETTEFLEENPIPTRFVSRVTERHIGSTYIPADAILTDPNSMIVDCEYFDIGTPEKLEIARKRYEN